MDVGTVKTRLELGTRARAWWEQQAGQAYNYSQWNKQWPSGTDFQKRIHLTFNRIAPLIHHTVGMYSESKLNVEISGRETSDQWISELFRLVFEQTCSEDDTHDKILDAIEDCMVCGMGYLKELVTIDSNLQPMVFSEGIDPFSIILDPNARSIPGDLSWLIELRKVPLEVAKNLFPDQKITPDKTYEEVVESPGAEARERYQQGAGTTDYTGEGGTVRSEDGEGAVTIVEMWYRKEELEQYNVSHTEAGPEFSVFEGKPKEGEEVFRHTVSDMWIATMVGDILVRDEPSPYGHGALRQKAFPYGFFLGQRLRGAAYRVGMPFLLFDQQDMYNKLNSLTIDAAVRNKNLGWMYRKGTLEPDQKKNLARFGSEPNVLLEYLTEPPQQNEPVPLSRAFVELADRVAMSFDEMSSWRDINRGGMPFETSGRGIMALQKQTSQSHARIERNIFAALIRFGKIRFSNIQQFMPLQLIDRITDKLSETAQDPNIDLSVEAQNLLDNSLGRYDIVFSIGVSQQRNKAALAEQFIALHDRGAVDNRALLEALSIPGWEAILQRIESQNQALQMGQSILEDPNLSGMVQGIQGNPELASLIMAIQQNPELLASIMSMLRPPEQAPPSPQAPSPQQEV